MLTDAQDRRLAQLVWRLRNLTAEERRELRSLAAIERAGAVFGKRVAS